MNQLNSNDKATNRLNIIESVKTPIGFFVIVVLVVEAIFGVVLTNSQGSERVILITSMIVLIFALIAIVVLLAVFRPEALKGERRAPTQLDEYEIAEIVKKVSELQEVIRALSEVQKEMSDELRKYYSVRSSVLALLAQDDVFNLDDVYSNLIRSSTHVEHRRAEVLSVIGILIEEGKVEGVPDRANYYRGVKGEIPSEGTKI